MKIKIFYESVFQLPNSVLTLSGLIFMWRPFSLCEQCGTLFLHFSNVTHLFLSLVVLYGTGLGVHHPSFHSEPQVPAYLFTFLLTVFFIIS